MPIHLSPMSRRQFLVRTIGAGAAVVLPAWARGAGKADPNRFALISDTHVATDAKATSRGVNMVEHFRRIATEVAGLDVPAAGALVSGDLAYNAGLKSDYQQFAPILGKLTDAKLPVHRALGNHEHRANFYSVLAEHKPAAALVAAKHVSIVQSPRANWFLLDSLEKTNVTPGLLGAEQLTWLTAALDARKDKPAIVMAHHDPHKPPAPKGGKPKRKTTSTPSSRSSSRGSTSRHTSTATDTAGGTARATASIWSTSRPRRTCSRRPSPAAGCSRSSSPTASRWSSAAWTASTRPTAGSSS